MSVINGRGIFAGGGKVERTLYLGTKKYNYKETGGDFIVVNNKKYDLADNLIEEIPIPEGITYNGSWLWWTPWGWGSYNSGKMYLYDANGSLIKAISNAGSPDGAIAFKDFFIAFYGKAWSSDYAHWARVYDKNGNILTSKGYENGSEKQWSNIRCNEHFVMARDNYGGQLQYLMTEDILSDNTLWKSWTISNVNNPPDPLF